MPLFPPFLAPLFLGAGLLLAAVLLAQFGGLVYLAVFPGGLPVMAEGLKWWFLVLAIDTALSRLPHPRAKVWRLAFQAGALFWFCAAAGAPEVGVTVLLLPVGLWRLSRVRIQRARWAALAILALCVVGGRGTFGAGSGWLLPALCLFLFFRLASWGAATLLRGERAGFFETTEYFWAPAFWLSPLHAVYLPWSRFRAGDAGGLADSRAGLRWVARGLLHAGVLSLLILWLLPLVDDLFARGWRAWVWWEWGAVGPVLFLLAYLEKSRVSYLAAGFLTLSGRAVAPDFHAPWAARDLLDYWRRFHAWVWEFYVDHLFTPGSVVLARKVGPAAAVSLGIFLTFLGGTFVSHHLAYAAPPLVNLGLAALFGLATLLHLVARPLLRRRFVGVPATWLTVFLLYILAYPAFGLGWGTARYVLFLRGGH